MLLGRGINVAPSNIRYEFLEHADWVGLKERGIEHVRIGGWIAEPLQSWQTCPASTRSMPTDEQEAVDVLVAGDSAVPDDAAGRAFINFRKATLDALDAGLMVVLNPFHQRQLVEVSDETVRWIWIAVLQEFNVYDFPVSRVAFEMINEPKDVVSSGSWKQMVHNWVAMVRREQPERVLILTGVQGWRGGHPPYVSSREGLLDDLRDGLVPIVACNARCMVTFHYYEPRYAANMHFNGSGPRPK